MSKEKDFTLPESNLEHKSKSVIKGIAGGIIPFAGGLVGESLDLIWKTAYEKRLSEWRINVSTALSKVANQNVLNGLIDNEEFKSLMAESTIIALKNHQEKKLSAISNLLAKSTVSPLEYDFKKLFLNYIDQFTVYHLKTLNNIKKNLNETVANFLTVNDHKSKILEEIFYGENELCNQVFEELEAIKGLITTKKGPFLNFETTTYLSLSKLGEKFMSLVEE